MGILLGAIGYLSYKSGTIKGTGCQKASAKFDNLQEQWQSEIYYYTDEKLQSELDRYNLPWKVNTDGRYKCVNALVYYNVKQNYKVI